MIKSVPSNVLTPNDSGEHRLTINQSYRECPQTNDTSVIDALQEQISFLRKELVETRLQLACAKSSEDILKLELATIKSADTNAPSNTYTCSFGANEAAGNNENTHQESTPEITSVPTADPMLRTKVHRTRTTSTKVLNPNSCSSGLNLLLGLESNGSLASLQRAMRTVLNPNSCASGLNIMTGLQSFYHDSMLSMASGISASELLRASQRNNASNVSRSSGNNLALLLGLGNARVLSSSSLRRGSSSRNNTRHNNNNNRRNADWGGFDGGFDCEEEEEN